MFAIQTVNRPIIIRRGIMNPASGAPEQAQPGNGSTITIFDSTANHNGVGNQIQGLPFSRLVLAIFSSHDSAATGLVVTESGDGVNFHAAPTYPQTYTAASGDTIYDIAVLRPHYKITYQNSANNLTSWDMSLTGVYGDRAKTT